MPLRDDTETRFGPPTVPGAATSRADPKPSLVDPGGEAIRIDRFTLLERIGMGGMGELYAAYDANLDRKVALKLVRTGRGGDKADSRLVREAQALAQIAHPNVVSVFDVGSAESRVFVAMEYVRGQTLSRWLAEARTRPEAERVAGLLAHFRDAARGLAAVHEVGLAHRDFKPDNVLVGDDGRVRLVDFGLARATDGPATPVPSSRPHPRPPSQTAETHTIATLVSEADDDDQLLTPDIEIGTLTNTGTLLGTPRYMAPEQWRTQRGDSRSDQFSFCAALYHALYGAWPFAAETMSELSTAVLSSPPREPPRKSEVPARLHAAVLRGLANDPEARWPNMDELIEAIEATLAPKRRRDRWILATLLVVLGVASWASFGAEPPRKSGEAAVTRIEREATAEVRRVQLRAQMAELDVAEQFEQADEVFAAFAGLARNHQTLAMTWAWLDQAGRLGARGETKRQLEALGEALLASPNHGERRAPLIALAKIQAHNHDYAQLGATLRVLGEPDGVGGVGPPDELDELDDLDELDELDELDDLELASMRVDEALSRRDITRALEILARPALGSAKASRRSALIAQLEHVSSPGLVAGRPYAERSSLVELPNLDVDDDGHPEFVFLPAEGPAQLLASRPALTVLQELDLAIQGQPAEALAPSGSPSGPGAPNWVSASSPAGAGLLALELEPDLDPDGDTGASQERVAVRSIPGTHANQWASADLFQGPGWAGFEAYGADSIGKQLIGFRDRQGRGEFEASSPAPSLAELESLVESVTIADLDGDGADELVVGVDGWWAYDLRVLSPSRDPGQFELAARRKIGGQAGITSFPAPTGRGQWLALSVPESPPSPRVFPASAPSGAAPGVYLLAWAGPGQALEVVDEVSLPTNARPGSADLDGDGLYEVVVQVGADLVLLAPGEDLDESMIWLEGLHYHAIVDLDHDGDDELIVSEIETGRVLIIGAGDEHLPVVERPLAPRTAAPSGLDPDIHERWARAETLATVGLTDRASAAFVELARMAPAPVASAALHRAAELLEHGGARRRAAELYRQAGGPDSLAHALELFEAVHEFDAAARVADQLVAAPGLEPAQRASWRERAAAVHRRAEPEVGLSFDFTEPLDPQWHLAQPGLVRSEASGLRLDPIGSDEPLLMRRFFEWDGDRLELELELELDRLEWGAALRFELVPVDAAGEASGPVLAAVKVGSVGGGGHYVLNTTTTAVLEPGSVHETPRMHAATPPEAQRQLRIRVDVTDDAATSWTTVTSLGDSDNPSELAYQRDVLPGARRPGRYELRVSTGNEPWMRGVVRLERLRLLGARADPSPPPPSPREQLLHALAIGDNALALARLEGADATELDPRDAAWLRALALEQLGQWAEAKPELAAALGRCDDPDALARFGYATLLVPDRFGPTLRELCPRDRYLINMWTVAWGTLFHHPDLPDIHRTMTTQLVELERCEPQDFELARACADLLSARSRGWFMQNLGAAADTDLRRAIEIVDAWRDRAELSAAEHRALRRLGALAHVRLGAVLVTRNQLDEAELELAKALDDDDAPEIIADVIVARSFFSGLYESPIWARVVAAQTGLE